MIPNWTNHLKTEEDKTRFKQQIMNSRSVMERLDVMIDNLEEDLNKAENTEDQYSSPSWAALQADRNGYRRALRKVKQLINLDQRNING